jgi:3-deoxy-7-phosphoheptulonate synthase
MTPKPASHNAAEGGYGYALSEKTSQTDDQRIKDVTPLPPPEHLIRFFPIAGTPVEKLCRRHAPGVRDILQRQG